MRERLKNIGGAMTLLASFGLLFHILYTETEPEYNLNQFRKIMVEKMISNPNLNSDARISLKAQEKFFNQFVESQGLIRIDGEKWLYDNKGNTVSDSKLVDLMRNYKF